MSAIVSVIIAVTVGFGVASATEPAPPSGGTCNNYGNGAVVVAPFCGANLAPTTTTTPPPVFPTRTTRSTVPLPTSFQTATPAPTAPGGGLCPQIIPQPFPGCPGYGQPFPY